MLKFARQHHSRSSSVDRSGLTNSPRGSPRSSSVERSPIKNRTSISPVPPPVPLRQTTTTVTVLKNNEDKQNKLKTNSDYEAISTLCLLPGSRNAAMAPMTPTLQKIASATSSTTTSILSPKSVLKRRYDFHRAVEKLVQEKFVPSSASSPTGTTTTTTTAAPSSVLPNGLDTSSESGYGSDQDSLNSQTNQVQTTIAPEQKQKQEPGKQVTNNSPGTNPSIPPPALPPRKKAQRKQVKFDSYVMLLQGLRDRDLETIVSHLEQVSDEAMNTNEVSSAFLTAILENREDIVSALLRRGFDVNGTADSAGLTGLHLAAAFNYLPLVKLILASGACIFALAHSSGKKAADLCSKNLPGFQACYAYLSFMEECLGIANQGRVYSSQTFHTARSDELQLIKGQCLNVIRKGDYPGSSWWWCKDQNGQQGYVLREILSLNPPTSV